MTRTLTSVLAAFLVSSAVPVFAQGDSGAGKLELSLVPAGWMSFTEGPDRPEPAFGQYMWGAAFTVNWSHVGLEADLFWALSRSQGLGRFGSSRTSPHVVVDNVGLVFPLTGTNNRRVLPFVTAGLGETTIMRTSDNTLQPDTETLTTGVFGGGVKWYGEGRWGFRGDYRLSLVRSKFDAPGPFFGRELRKSHRIYGAIVVNLIPRQ